MEDFVPFEIAKKLKEKGFEEECLAYYTSEYTLYTNKVVLCDDKYLEVAEIDYEECLRSYNTQKDRLLRTIVDAPTISQVLKWLRELLEIDILPNIIISYTDDLKRIRLYSCNIYSPRLNKVIKTEYFDSYEAAVITGIKYVLDNLI